MHFNQLRYFIVVAELENLTLAAARLRIAQSAVSRQIKLLEQELGTTLLERVGRGVKLTAAGKTLLERGRHLLDEVKQIEAEVPTQGNTPAGTLRIGANPSFGHALFPRLAERYWKNFPNVKLHFVTDLTGPIQDWVRRGDLDFAIVSFPDKDTEFINLRLTSESIFVISAADNDPDLGPECTIRSVSELPLLLPGLPNRERLGYERLAAAKGYSLSCRMESDSLSVLKSLASRGFGHLLLPHVAIADDEPKGTWKISRVKGFAVERYIVRSSKRPVTRAAATIIDLIQDEVRSLRSLGVVR
ncbi:MAG: LysR family transcriptional regulator [Xanthobacteraceae bacterium]